MSCLFGCLRNSHFVFASPFLQSYEQLFRDVRKCVDLCHRDGVIKDRVEEDPARYIIPDPEMVPMLKRFRKEGVQVLTCVAH